MRFFTRTSTIVVMAAGTALLAPAAEAADTSANASVSAGRAAFNNYCRTCHSTKKGDNRIGPSLYRIVGAKAGTRPGFAAYSQAMKNSGIVWDEKTLDRFIANPEEVVPNNNMKPFKGIPDPAVRKSIIEFLKAESGGG
jgi:cytochrome c